MPITESKPLPTWLRRGRRVYRFLDKPIGNLSRRAKYSLAVYTILLLLALWAVRPAANLPVSGPVTHSQHPRQLPPWGDIVGR